MNSDKPRILASHEIQVLRRAGHAQREIATLAGVSLGSVRRVERETALTHVNSERERERRAIGRPAEAEPFRSRLVEVLTQEPDLLSVEVLRRAKLAGYTGGKTALCELIRTLRPRTVRSLVHFEGLPESFRRRLRASPRPVSGWDAETPVVSRSSSRVDLRRCEAVTRPAVGKCQVGAARRPGPGRRRRPQGRSAAEGLDAVEHGATLASRRRRIMAIDRSNPRPVGPCCIGVNPRLVA